jgi:hypothetical protein
VLWAIDLCDVAVRARASIAARVKPALLLAATSAASTLTPVADENVDRLLSMFDLRDDEMILRRERTRLAQVLEAHAEEIASQVGDPVAAVRLVAHLIDVDTGVHDAHASAHLVNVVMTNDDDMQSLRDQLERCLAAALQSDVDHATAIADAQEVHDDRVGGLQVVIASRDLIGQAKGIIIAAMSCTADEAFALLVKQSQAEQRKLVDVADSIVATAVRRR